MRLSEQKINLAFLPTVIYSKSQCFNAKGFRRWQLFVSWRARKVLVDYFIEVVILDEWYFSIFSPHKGPSDRFSISDSGAKIFLLSLMLRVSLYLFFSISSPIWFDDLHDQIFSYSDFATKSIDGNFCSF